MTNSPQPDILLQIIQEISEVANQAHTLDTILNKVVSIIATPLQFDVVSIYLYDTKKKKVCLRSTIGLNFDNSKLVELNPGEGLTGFVYDSRRPLMVNPASQHPRYKYFPDIGETDYESYIGVPILLRDRCLGVLVGQTGLRHFFVPAEETLFQVIAARLAGLLEVADRLDRLKSKDLHQLDKKVYQGKGVSSGMAIGPAFFVDSDVDDQLISELKPKTKSKELTRFKTALGEVIIELEKLIRTFEKDNTLSQAEINIFHAHILILNDPSYQEQMIKKINEGMTAENSVFHGTQDVALPFENQEDAYLKDRGLDFRDLGNKLIEKLLESRGKVKTKFSFPEGAILIANTVGTSSLSFLHKGKVGAIVSEKGGATSHSAILARSLGIPAITGIENLSSICQAGDKLLVDGATGFVFIDPEESIIKEYKHNQNKQSKLMSQLEKKAIQTPSQGLKAQLSANIGFPVDLEQAKKYDVKKAGLFRTEFVFMRFSKWPTINEQEKVYAEAATHFTGDVTIRTLDIGADKNLPYFSLPEEENPLLGLRSIRFSMEYPYLFKEQIRAILLAMQTSRSRFKILLPMITHLWEVETAKEILNQAGKEIGIPVSNMPELGMMIEVPSVLYHLDDFKDLVQFFSVGTNDLIQYLTGVDRNSKTVDHLYSFYQPGFLKAMYWALQESKRLGKEITVCGEMAGDVKGALTLFALGYRNLSLLPIKIPLIQYLSKVVSPNLLSDVQNNIFYQKKESETQRFLEETLEKIDPILLEAN